MNGYTLLIFSGFDLNMFKLKSEYKKEYNQQKQTKEKDLFILMLHCLITRNVFRCTNHAFNFSKIVK